MKTKFGFIQMNPTEFKAWIENLAIARTVTRLQMHHTYSPDYKLFNGNNHFELQKGMKDYHVNHNGWMDMGQHFTIFPDGTILTGRSPELSPAGILGQNANAICIENLGNFDSGKDNMTREQKDAIVRVTAVLSAKFNLQINSNTIIYHHWFRLDSGARNNGSGNNKTCPGSAFFGGNKVTDCEQHFLPLVVAGITGIQPPVPVINSYVMVTASSLNIRQGPGKDYSKVSGISATTYGSVLRVYAEQNGWLKISASREHWVSKTWTAIVKKARVTADTLNIRNGPSTLFSKIGSLKKDEELFINAEQNGWCRISLDEKWVKGYYIEILD